MLSPKDLVLLAHTGGQVKIKNKASKTFILSVFAGVFIGFGAAFFVTVTSSQSDFPLKSTLGGIAFSLGLVLVIIGRAELFTGSHLMVLPWLNKKITLIKMLRYWGIIYIGNFLGAILLAILVFLTAHYLQEEGVLGLRYLELANNKISLDFWTLFIRGVLCNMLVCLAVWLAMTSRGVAGKILCIIFPISAFVAMGLEHSVANMYFIPMALMIKNFAPEIFWQNMTLQGLVTNDLSTVNFFYKNLIPVTCGNILGGSIIGAAYWGVYKDDT